MPIPRVVGIETEYGISRRSARTKEIYLRQQPIEDTAHLVHSIATHVGWDYLSERELPLLLEGRTLEDVANTVLANGARFYEDHGHPEYATPECTSPRQVVIYDKAGERILNLARIAVNRELAQTGQFSHDEIALYKNNADAAGHAFGCHENYLIERRTPWEKIKAYLTPFLVTRQIFTGAGKVGIQDPDAGDRRPTPKHPVIGGKTGLEHPLAAIRAETQRQQGEAWHHNFENQAIYQLSQRPDFFISEEGPQTTFARPLINTRDEPHADPQKYRRLHVIVGDANLAPWSTYLKVGTTMLVLDLIEDGFIDDEVIILEPVQTFKSISRDQDWAWQLRFAGGKTGNALDHQERYLNKAKQHYSADPLKKEIIEKWEYVLDALQKHDLDALEDKLDHVIKKRIIDRARERHGWDLTAPQIQKLALRYHSINPEESIYSLMERRGYIDTLAITESAIDHAIQHPPPDTRAYFRGRCIQKFTDQVIAANWDLIDIRRSSGVVVRIPMEDPFKGTASLTQTLIEGSPTIEALLSQL